VADLSSRKVLAHSGIQIVFQSSPSPLLIRSIRRLHVLDDTVMLSHIGAFAGQHARTPLDMLHRASPLEIGLETIAAHPSLASRSPKPDNLSDGHKQALDIPVDALTAHTCNTLDSATPPGHDGLHGNHHRESARHDDLFRRHRQRRERHRHHLLRARHVQSLVLLTLIFVTFRRFRGLYFWSLLTASFGIIPYDLGFIIEYFQLTAQVAGLVVTAVGWPMLVTGQSLVLYSRLGVLMAKEHRNLLRAVKWMIIVDGVVLHTSTLGTALRSRLPYNTN